MNTFLVSFCFAMAAIAMEISTAKYLLVEINDPAVDINSTISKFPMSRSVASEEKCDCEYRCKWGHDGAVGCNGGCKITISPPTGWKCECVYRGAWTCAGYARLCYELDPHCIENSGCKERRCCSGDCEGY